MVFCHISIRIRHIYTHVPSLPDIPPISLPTPPFNLLQSPCLSSLRHTTNPHGYLFYTWYCKFLCYSLHTSSLLPPLLPLCSLVCSLHLFLPCCPENKFISAITSDSIYTCQYMIFIFLFLTYFTLCNRI